MPESKQNAIKYDKTRTTSLVYSIVMLNNINKRLNDVVQHILITLTRDNENSIHRYIQAQHTS